MLVTDLVNLPRGDARSNFFFFKKKYTSRTQQTPAQSVIMIISKNTPKTSNTQAQSCYI